MSPVIASSTPAIPSPEDLAARAHALVPVLRDRAARTEAQRSVLPETIADLRRAGLFRAVQPRRYGGYELSWPDFVAIVVDLARGCGSTAWVYSVLADHQATLAMFHDAAQRDVWGEDSDSLVSTSLVPQGSAVRVPGGYRLDGRWKYSSGCDHVGWIMLGSIVDGGSGTAEAHMFLVPMSDCRIDDTWFVMGLAGTGSKDVLLANVFVPDHRVIPTRDSDGGTAPGTAVNSFALYRMPRKATSPLSLAAVAVGVALGAVERFTETLRHREARGMRLADVGPLQMRIAEAAAEVDCAKLLLLDACRRTMTSLERGERLTIDERARNRRDQGYTVLLATRAVDRLFAATGGGGLQLGDEMQRAFRDVHGVQAHLYLGWDIAATTYGRVALGLDPGSPLI
jgi:alkylation response protein AidB-like acyl-CoA dehydrogenase